MYLKSLSLINFKNYREAEFEFHDKVNCFVGNNGEGKTNILDAIYYLSFCKSFFNPSDVQNIQHEEPFFVVQGEFSKEGEVDKIHCGVKRGQNKVFKKNKKEYERLAEHIGAYPLVMISPSDSILIYEGGEERRKFIDGIIAQYDREYLDHLIQYNKALAQRNALLKLFFKERRFDRESIVIWNEQLVKHGVYLFEKRKQFIHDFEPIFQEYFNVVSGKKEVVELQYESQLLHNNLSDLLIEAEGEDSRKQYTTIGVHKDELMFNIGHHPLKKFGSQGQQKSYLIALKIAQLEFLKRIKKVNPILLLDDIFDKLDENRVKHLLELVNTNQFGQIFITDTHPERIEQLLKAVQGSHKMFEIEKGAVKKVWHEEK